MSREPVERCDNNFHRLGGPILAPGCLDQVPTRTITIQYSAAAFDADVLRLCEDCAKRIAADARRYGYTVKGAAR